MTRDGTTLVYQEVAQQGYDLGLIETTGAGTPREFLATRFNKVQGRLSPNQRWMAYASDESGRFQMYVRPFPEGSAQTTVSIAVGMQPRWRGDGKEPFYLAPNGQLMAIPVTTDGPAFSAAGRGAAPALVEGATGRVLTYAQLVEQVRRLVPACRARASGRAMSSPSGHPTRPSTPSSSTRSRGWARSLRSIPHIPRRSWPTS